MLMELLALSDEIGKAITIFRRAGSWRASTVKTLCIVTQTRIGTSDPDETRAHFCRSVAICQQIVIFRRRNHPDLFSRTFSAARKTSFVRRSRTRFAARVLTKLLPPVRHFGVANTSKLGVATAASAFARKSCPIRRQDRRQRTQPRSTAPPLKTSSETILTEVTSNRSETGGFLATNAIQGRHAENSCMNVAC